VIQVVSPPHHSRVWDSARAWHLALMVSWMLWSSPIQWCEGGDAEEKGHAFAPAEAWHPSLRPIRAIARGVTTAPPAYGA
jgi:hypothetical protein